MKFKSLYLPTLLLLGALVNGVQANDVYPPAWRGTPSTTFQVWNFATSTSLDNYSLTNLAPDSVTNAYGSPLLDLNSGSFGSGWWDNSGGDSAFIWGTKSGLWDIGDGSIHIAVPNFSSTHSKLVQLQVTYMSGGVYQVPTVTISSGAVLISSNATVVTNAPFGESWFTARYIWQYSASPASETITLTGGSTYGSIIDQVIVDTQITNAVPVVTSYALNRTAGLGLKIFWSDVTNHWSDLDGDALHVASISLTSTNGAVISTNASFILYPQAAAGVNDQIAYQVTDNLGGTVTGLINILVNQSVTGTNSITSIVGGNPTTLSANGIPGFTYVTERSTNLVSWVSISTNTAAGSGVVSVSDSFSDLGNVAPVAAYYRLKWSGN